jgi:hypothetical protein
MSAYGSLNVGCWQSSAYIYLSERRCLMSRTYHHGKNNPHKDEKIIRKLGKAIIELTEAKLEKEALLEHQRKLKQRKAKVSKPRQE